MEKDQLTTAKALNFARHDFLNKLQIVLMHIDLDNIPSARKTILNVTDEMRQLARLELLGLPVTANWLMTFGWLYPVYEKVLTCTGTGKPEIRVADDVEVASYLDQIFQGMKELLDPAVEYEAHIYVSSSSTDWSIKIVISGAMLGLSRTLETAASFIIEETNSDNLWTFTLSGQ